MTTAGLSEAGIVGLVSEFEACFNTNDVDGLMSRMTEDTVFEHVAPPEVSFGRYEGAGAVRGVWASMSEHFPEAHFRVDDIFAAGDRCVCRYTMTYRGEDGTTATRLGVDVFRIRGGLISEKLTYLTL